MPRVRNLQKACTPGFRVQRELFRVQANKGKTPSKGTRGGQRKDQESKQKTTPQSSKPAMGSLRRRNQITSLVARSKLCKEMGEKLGRTPSLEVASLSCCCNCRSQDSGGLNFLNTAINYYLPIKRT